MRLNLLAFLKTLDISFCIWSKASTNLDGPICFGTNICVFKTKKKKERKKSWHQDNNFQVFKAFSHSPRKALKVIVRVICENNKIWNKLRRPKCWNL
jgi:hypothetical protein